MDEPTRIHDLPPQSSRAMQTLSGDPEGMVGRVLKGAYRIEGKIGEGGMGVVYRATQIALGRPVAVKMIHVGSRIPASGVERFFREGRLLSQLHHPNIVHIIDFGTEPGPLHFMVMEFLSGEPLDAFVARRGRLAPDLVVDLMEQICAGMTAAHTQGIIHRDLKPSNIFVLNVTGSPRPVIKVLDFGLGKNLDPTEEGNTAITREGIMMGTCGYSAPEQMHGGPADARSDVYSLGSLLYFLVAARPPYRDEGLRSTLVKQLTSPPDPLEPDPNWVDLPAVEAVIQKALSVRPAERHASPAELMDEVLGTVHRHDTFAERGSAGTVPGRGFSRVGPKVVLPAAVVAGGKPPRSRRRWWIAAGAAVLLAAAGLAGWLLYPCNDGATATGVTAREIKFGLSGPFTGRNAELGPNIETGILARFQAENERGGVYCRQLALKALDDSYDPEKAKENVLRLAEVDGVFSFVGNVGTPTAKVAMPVATNDLHRVYFAPLTGGRVLRKDPPSQWVFNYRASYSDETAQIVRYLIDEREVGPGEIAVFSQNDAYGDDGFEGVAHALRTKHGVRREQILHVRYERDTPDLDKAVKAVVAARKRIKAVVMVCTYGPGSRFIKAIRDAGLDAICTNVSFVGSDALAAKLRAMKPRARYCKGVIVTQVVPPVDSQAHGVIQYRKDLARYSHEAVPNPVSLEGYIAASILIEGLKKAGKNLTPETLIRGLEKLENLDLGIGATITFTKSDHQGSRRVWITELDENGKYQEVTIQ